MPYQSLPSRATAHVRISDINYKQITYFHPLLYSQHMRTQRQFGIIRVSAPYRALQNYVKYTYNLIKVQQINYHY